MIECFSEIEALPSIVWSMLSTVVKLTEHPNIELHIRFDIAQGLYWFATDYHSGQASELYSVLSCLEYNPSPLENEPNTEESKWVYEALKEYYL